MWEGGIGLHLPGNVLRPGHLNSEGNWSPKRDHSVMPEGEYAKE